MQSPCIVTVLVAARECVAESKVVAVVQHRFFVIKAVAPDESTVKPALSHC